MNEHHSQHHAHAECGHAPPVSSASAPALEGATAKDPVCGMTVDPARAQHRAEHAGKTYFFCSGNCRSKFIADPSRFIAPQSKAPAPAPVGTIYTCPMHPQIRQPGPGTCPICGMALEPEVATAESGPSAELIDMRRRFWIGLVLSLPVVVLEMGGHF